MIVDSQLYDFESIWYVKKDSDISSFLDVQSKVIDMEVIEN